MSRLAGALVVALRWLVVPAWFAAAVAAVVYLPALGEARGAALGSLVPQDAAALEVQQRSARLFDFPVLASTLVVQRDPRGLSEGEQARVFRRAARINSADYPDLLAIPFALPITNTLGFFPGSRELSTTAITYLYFEPGVSLTDRYRLARTFANREIAGEGDPLVGVTGVVPARVTEGNLIRDALPLVELATVILVALVIGLNFRSVWAPLLTLLAVGLSYVISLRVVGWVGLTIGIEAPRELEPIMLVLVLGLVTDYCIFFLSGFRHRLLEGDRSTEAARRTAGEFWPIIGVAGLIVAAGTAALLVAELEFFRIFGPSLALTVLVGLAVSLTFVPAALALAGRRIFWPTTPRRPPVTEEEPRASRTMIVRLTGSRLRAAVFAVASVAVLVAAATGTARTDLAVTPIRGLPGDAAPARAAEAAAQGFAPGILAPTLLLLEGPGLRDESEALGRLQGLLEGQPTVAGVIGPGNVPRRVPLGAVVAREADAVRYVLILDQQPLSSEAIAGVRELRRVLPFLLERAGLEGVEASFGGNTAIAEETIDAIVVDLVRVSVAVLLVNLVLLVLFLRALVAPLYLLAASVLALLATLGATAFFFDVVVGRDHLTYYVPFMAAVLLVSLGSDYNVFLVGRIWQEARRRPLREAVAIAAPRASRAISAAALALALSFALLALVPLSSFREFAFAMFVGVLIDAFVVRTYLVPALLTLVGAKSGWPGRLRPTPVPPRP